MRGLAFWRILLLGSLLFTGACGGGGDGDNSPVPSTEVFQLKTAWINHFKETTSRTFTVSGTSSGIKVSGSGAVTYGSISPSIFEGIDGFEKKTSIITKFSVNGQSIPETSVIFTEYVDNDYFPIGSYYEEYGGYFVVDQPVSIPETILVNETSILLTETIYSDSLKSSIIGTNTLSFLLDPDTASTGLLKIIETEKDILGNIISTTILVFRMTPSGSLTPLYESYVSDTNDLTLKY